MSKYPQVSSQKNHPNTNVDCSKVINVGNWFGIPVKTKLSKRTKSNFKKICLPNKCLLEVQQGS